MASSSSKWLTGCGIGCGVIILIGILIGVVGYFAVRGTVEEFREAEASQEYLEARFGKVEDFTPDSSGEISRRKIEAFLAVRDSMVFAGEGIEETFDTIAGGVEALEDEAQDGKFWRIIGLVRKGMGAIPQFAAFYRIRNDALMVNDLSLGEYYYLYVTAYYSWLEKPLEDGPEFNIMGDQDYRRFSWDEEEEEEAQDEIDVYEERRYRVLREVRKLVLPMMRRMLTELEDNPYGVDEAWHRALSDEVEAMREDRDRIPWEGGVPRVIRISLEPFRYELEESYNPIINPLELGAEDE